MLRFGFLVAFLVVTAGRSALWGQELPAPDVELYRTMGGAELYETACASCHGFDGTGTAASILGFQEEMPDFTGCSFASREPDSDWIAISHEGGPTRGFSQMMPAFGDILSPDDLQRVMDYVRTLCEDASWPRGELNFPRAMLTEKAYPEDEAVWTTDLPVEGGENSVMNELTYEKRVGSRSQLEVVVPFGFRERGEAEAEGAAGGWVGGLGDLVLGAKNALFHSIEAGSILSLGGEVKLPTGKTEDGFGGGTTVVESFASFGQALPADAFIQIQGVAEFPTTSGHADEAVVRGLLGRTFSQGRWGRTWSPMMEIQAKRELAAGEEWGWDLVPQVQVSLNTRQHVMANVAVLLPVGDSGTRNTRLYLYVLWDWFDGGFFEGW